MLPWARALAVLYTTRMAAWTPSLGVRGLFLAALPQLQNQIKSNGERFHVITWYCFAPMGPTLCACLDDPYGSLNARVWPQGGTFGRARPPSDGPASPATGAAAVLSLSCRPAAAAQPLGCCHGPETRVPRVKENMIGQSASGRGTRLLTPSGTSGGGCGGDDNPH